MRFNVKTTDSHPVLKILAAFFIAFAFSVGVDFFAAMVFQRGWNWFIVPAAGFQPLSYWLAFGVMSICSFIYSCITWAQEKSSASNDEESDDFSKFVARLIGKAVGAIVGMTIFLGIMALVSLGV